MSRRSLFALAALLTASALPAETPPPATLEITVSGARANTGLIRIALCPAQAKFPDCGAKAVRTASLPVSAGGARVVLTGLAPGNYAVSVFHDANSNGKLDTFAGVPREGYGFSRNPPFRPRAPRFNEAELAVSGDSRAAIGLRYIL